MSNYWSIQTPRLDISNNLLVFTHGEAHGDAEGGSLWLLQSFTVDEDWFTTVEILCQMTPISMITLGKQHHSLPSNVLDAGKASST